MVLENDLEISYPQHIFLNELNTKFRAYVGGFGSGKTYVGCLDLLLFMKKYPTYQKQYKHVKQGYFGPTYSAISDIFYPTLQEAAETFNWETETKRKDAFIYNSAGNPVGHVMCRSMDRPDSIVGFKIARALVDEIDTLSTDKAEKSWRKIIARMRLTIEGVVNGIGVTCTPEGFLFVYDQFKKNPTESYSMVQASTYENIKHLPEDYIPSLLETYPSQLVEAYVNGNFVNLTSGTVYYNFCRVKNNTHYVIRPREPLHIGMDFNVYNMAAIVHVIRDGIAYAVDELIGLRDTPDMIAALLEKYEEHNISIYPDSSGDNKSSKGATLSDITLLEDEFTVYANTTNPLIKNRVQSMNKRFESNQYYVNVNNCPQYANALEQQVYNKITGQPDKGHGLDHPVDAGGYFISFMWPIQKIPVKKLKVSF